MNRSDFSLGKRAWPVACAKCSKFKGFCKCAAANIIISNVNNAPATAFELNSPNWVAAMFGGNPIVVRELVGMAVTNPEGVTHGTMRPMRDEDGDEYEEWVEDEM